MLSNPSKISREVKEFPWLSHWNLLSLRINCLIILNCELETQKRIYEENALEWTLLDSCHVHIYFLVHEIWSGKFHQYDHIKIQRGDIIQLHLCFRMHSKAYCVYMQIRSKQANFLCYPVSLLPMDVENRVNMVDLEEKITSPS